MSKKAFCLGLSLMLAGAAGFSLDFGGVLSQTAALEPYGAGELADFSYDAAISPWASAVLPNQLALFLSASLTGRYKAEKWRPVFELDRFELTWQPRPAVFLEAGRFNYTDPLGLVAAGLFDGAAGVFGLGNTRLSLGAFYTGLLHKETANIVMSGGDSLDYADDGASWAPSRFFGAAVYTIPELFSWKDALQAGFTGQFDLRDDGSPKLHTQYLTVLYQIAPLDALFFDIGGIFGLSEAGTERPLPSYAFSFTGNWSLPTKINDQMSLRFRYGSGRGEGLGAFTPITGVSQSSVFSAKLSGLMALSMIYTSRLAEQLSLVKESTFLMRTDAVSFSAEGLDPASESPLLGFEIFLKLVWAPFSDLGLNAGGGVFLPFPDGAFQNTTPAWKISAGLVVSF
jgi:hypothetical protein